MCFLGNHNVEKANFLSMWSLPRQLFIFGAVVIVMMKGSATVAALPWLGQLHGRRDRGTDTELLPQPGMAGMGVPPALLPVQPGCGKHWRHTGGKEAPNSLPAWSCLGSDPGSFPGMVPRPHHRCGQ